MYGSDHLQAYGRLFSFLSLNLNGELSLTNLVVTIISVFKLKIKIKNEQRMLLLIITSVLLQTQLLSSREVDIQNIENIED